MAQIKLTNAEIRARLLFKWKKKIRFGICHFFHFWQIWLRGECYNCKETKTCESYRKRKMFSGS